MLELETRSTIRWEGSVYSTICTLISTVCCFHSQTLDLNGQTPGDVFPWTLGQMPEEGKGTDCICSWTPSVSGKSATSPIQTGYSALSTHAQIVYTAYTYTHAYILMQVCTHARTCATPTHTRSPLFHFKLCYIVYKPRTVCVIVGLDRVFWERELCVAAVFGTGTVCFHCGFIGSSELCSVPWQLSKHWVWLRNVPSSVRARK